MVSSHANYHAHKATHDNDYVEWEEEWLITSVQILWSIAKQTDAVVISIK